MTTPRSDNTTLPFPKEAAEAKRHPNDYVYRIADYAPGGRFRLGAIVGAWRVDGDGNIVGDFLPNPNFMPKP